MSTSNEVQPEILESVSAVSDENNPVEVIANLTNKVKKLEAELAYIQDTGWEGEQISMEIDERNQELEALNQELEELNNRLLKDYYELTKQVAMLQEEITGLWALGSEEEPW